jgi:type IV pilus assembly protein PilE
MQLKPNQTGFTLIELLIVVVVIGILTAIAVPSYMDSVRKSRRADGKTALMTYAQAQEKYRANNPTYATTLASISINTTSPDGYYTIALVGTPNATSHSATATPTAKGGQSSDSCTFTVTQDGPDKSTAEKIACWGS